MPVPVRYEMTAREKQIEEFYLGVIARILAAKDDEARLLRVELKNLADLHNPRSMLDVITGGKS